MWTFIVLLLVVLFLLLVISMLMSNIEVKLLFHKSGRYERIWVGIRVWHGIIRWRYEIKSIQFKGMGEGFQLGVQHKDNFGTGHAGSYQDNVNKQKIRRAINWVDLWKKHIYGITQWLKETLFKIKVTQFVWDTEVGAGRAPDTAILSGLTWSATTVATGLMTRYFRFIDRPHVEVVPHFNTPYFSTRVVCISRIRVSQAIGAVLVLIYRMMRVEGGLRPWRIIQSKAS
ncbi:DUF2953 domain-containing protein [Paenibacillus taiwanensis]|uniref:DUF2953 domain-containing protein n=1 Tax=Paenibacillus taiwanensis TaxID=401638 RepID=UPI00055B5490|nr:DUF2953 domain-containing protein [Paenibacillus taiwanensis]